MATLHFLWFSDIPVSVCVCLHTYLWHLACLHALGIVNSAAMNTGVHVSFWMRVFIFPGCLPESEVVGSDSSSIFSFLRKLHAVPHSGCSSSHSYQQCRRAAFPTPCLAFIIYRLSKDGPLDQRAVVTHCIISCWDESIPMAFLPSVKTPALVLPSLPFQTILSAPAPLLRVSESH